MTPSFRESMDSSDSSTPKNSLTRNSGLDSPTTSLTQPSVQYTPSRESASPPFSNLICESTPAKSSLNTPSVNRSRNRSPASDGHTRMLFKTPTSGSEMGYRSSDISLPETGCLQVSTPSGGNRKE